MLSSLCSIGNTWEIMEFYVQFLHRALVTFHYIDIWDYLPLFTSLYTAYDCSIHWSHQPSCMEQGYGKQVSAIHKMTKHWNVISFIYHWRHPTLHPWWVLIVVVIEVILDRREGASSWDVYHSDLSLHTCLECWYRFSCFMIHYITEILLHTHTKPSCICCTCPIQNS